MNGIHLFARNVVRTVFARGLGLALGLFTSIASARFLGPEGRAIYAVAFSIAEFGAQVGALGLSSGNTYFTSKDHSVAGIMKINTFWITIFSSFVFGILAVISYVTIEGYINISRGELALSLLLVPMGIYQMLLSSIALGIGNIALFTRIELYSRLLFASVITILIGIKTLSVISFMVASLVAQFAIVVFAWSQLPRTGLLPNINLFKRQFWFSAKSYLGSLFAFAGQRADIIIYNTMLSRDELGQYSVSYNLAMIAYTVLVTAVGSIIFPILCSGESNDPQRLRITHQTALFIGLIMAILAALSWLYGDWIITFLYGERYHESGKIFGIIMTGTIFYSITTIYNQFISANGNPIAGSIILPFIMCLICAFIKVEMCRKRGMEGAAIGSTIGYSLLLIVTYVYCLILARNSMQSARVSKS